MTNETPAPTIPDVDIDPGTEPLRRLEPDKLCPDQQADVTKKVIEVIP